MSELFLNYIAKSLLLSFLFLVLYAMKVWITWLFKPVKFVKASLKKRVLTAFPALLGFTGVGLIFGPLAPFISATILIVTLYKGLTFKYIPVMDASGKEIFLNTFEKWQYDFNQKQEYRRLTTPMLPVYRFQDAIAGKVSWDKIEDVKYTYFLKTNSEANIIEKKTFGDYFWPFFVSAIYLAIVIGNIASFNELEGGIFQGILTIIMATVFGIKWGQMFISNFTDRFIFDTTSRTLTHYDRNDEITNPYAVQLIKFKEVSTAHSNKGSTVSVRTVYQVNIITSDVDRIPISNSTSCEVQESNAELFSYILDIPLWDNTEEKRIAKDSPQAKEMEILAYQSSEPIKEFALDVEL